MEINQQGKIKRIQNGKEYDYMTIEPLNRHTWLPTALQITFWSLIVALVLIGYWDFLKYYIVLAIVAIAVMAWYDRKDTKNWFLNEVIGFPKDHLLTKGDIVTINLRVDKK